MEHVDGKVVGGYIMWGANDVLASPLHVVKR
jgi:hypothetical protein